MQEETEGDSNLSWFAMSFGSHSRRLCKMELPTVRIRMKYVSSERSKRTYVQQDIGGPDFSRNPRFGCGSFLKMKY